MHLKVKKKNLPIMMIRTIVNIFLFLILLFSGHSERSASFRDRRCRQNHNSNFLLHQFDSAGPAGGGTRDSPHQKSCQRAAGGYAGGAQGLFCPAGFSPPFVSLPGAAGASPTPVTSSQSSLWRCGELEEHFLILVDVCQM